MTMRFFPPLFTRFFSHLSSPALALCGFTAPALAAGVLLAAGPAGAQPAVAPATGLVVESVREVAADPTMAEVELVLTNTGQDALYLTAIAKSRDGLVQSPQATADDTVPPGAHQHLSLFIQRPWGANAGHTGKLWVAGQQVNHPEAFVRVSANWSHDWPAEAGAVTKAVDKSGLLPHESDTRAFIANINEEDFAAADLLLREWNTPAQRDTSGLWKLEGFRAAIATLVHNGKWDALRSRLERWQHADPQSPGAALALAEAQWQYAWTLRRCACAPVTHGDSDAMKEFRQHVRLARWMLDDSREYAATNPLWYEIYVNVQADRGRNRRSMRVTQRIFDEGVTRYPLFQPLYLAMARYWAPNDGRHANWQAVEAVAESAVDNSRATDGDDNYAWVYAYLSVNQQLEVDILRDSKLSWPRLRASFEELVKRHPSVDNYNLFTVFACRAGDMKAYSSLRDKIRGHVETALWPENYSLDVCDHHFAVKNWM